MGADNLRYAAGSEIVVVDRLGQVRRRADRPSTG